MKSFILSLAFFCILKFHASNCSPYPKSSGYYEYPSYSGVYSNEYGNMESLELSKLKTPIKIADTNVEEGSGGSGDLTPENVISSLTAEGFSSDVEANSREYMMLPMIGDDEDLADESGSGDNDLLQLVEAVADGEASGDYMEENYKKTSAPTDDEDASVSEIEYSESSGEISGGEEKQTSSDETHFDSNGVDYIVCFGGNYQVYTYEEKDGSKGGDDSFAKGDSDNGSEKSQETLLPELKLSKGDNDPIDQVAEILSTELPTINMDKDLDGDFDVKINIEDIIDKIRVVVPPMREIIPSDNYDYENLNDLE